MKDKTITASRTVTSPWILPAAALLALVAALFVTSSAYAHRDKDDRRIRIERVIKRGAFLGVKLQALTDEVLEGLDTSTTSGVLVSEVIE